MWLVAGIGVAGIVTYGIANMINRSHHNDQDEKKSLISSTIIEEEEP